MASKTLKTIYGYKIQILEKEKSTKFDSDFILFIIRNNHTEIIDIEDINNIKHLMGDIIPKSSIFKDIKLWIQQNYDYCIKEINKRI